MPRKRYRVWRMFAGRDHSQWKYWLEYGVMSIGWGMRTEIGCPHEYESLSELEEDFGEYFDSLKQCRLAARNLWRFSRLARIGDLVCVYDEGSIFGIGEIQGPCEYIDDDIPFDSGELYAYRRDVEWYSTTRHRLSSTMKEAVFKRYEGSICRIEDETTTRILAAWALSDLQSAEELKELRDEIAEEDDDTEDNVYHLAKVIRAKRDRQKALRFRSLNRNRCQICRESISLPNGQKLVEVHHIKPLGRKHRGKDWMSNMMCLCPNHHAEMDRGAFYIDSVTKKVVHFNKSSPINGIRIDSLRNTWPAPHNLKYQRDHICCEWVS